MSERPFKNIARCKTSKHPQRRIHNCACCILWPKCIFLCEIPEHVCLSSSEENVFFFTFNRCSRGCEEQESPNARQCQKNNPDCLLPAIAECCRAMFFTFPSYMSQNEKATRQITINNDFCETPIVCRWSQTSHHAHQTSPAVPPAVLLVAECCGRGPPIRFVLGCRWPQRREFAESMSLSLKPHPELSCLDFPGPGLLPPPLRPDLCWQTEDTGRFIGIESLLQVCSWHLDPLLQPTFMWLHLTCAAHPLPGRMLCPALLQFRSSGPLLQ